MATLRLCSIPDCGKPVAWRGWCNGHYLRWQRHGDPLGGGTSLGEPHRFYREVVLTYEGDECLIWPYGKSAYGYGELNPPRGSKATGKPPTRSVHRLLCEHVNGPPPEPNYDAAHSCGKGHTGCVTKKHLSWKTHADNMADKIVHDTHNRGERQWKSKLTEQQAREILALYGIMNQRQLADRYGVGQDQISRILSGKRWSWLQSP